MIEGDKKCFEHCHFNTTSIEQYDGRANHM